MSEVTHLGPNQEQPHSPVDGVFGYYNLEDFLGAEHGQPARADYCVVGDRQGDVPHDAHERPILRADNSIVFVPGLNGGSLAGCGLTAELANRLHEAIDFNYQEKPPVWLLPEQPDPAKYKDMPALDAQANNLLAILEHTHLGNQESVKFVTHSFGSLVLARAMQLAEKRKIQSFENAEIVLVAPAGLYEDEDMAKLAARFAGVIKDDFSIRSDSNRIIQEAINRSVKEKGPSALWQEISTIANLKLSDLGGFEGCKVHVLANDQDPLFAPNLIKDLAEDLGFNFRTLFGLMAGDDLEAKRRAKTLANKPALLAVARALVSQHVRMPGLAANQAQEVIAAWQAYQRTLSKLDMPISSHNDLFQNPSRNLGAIYKLLDF